MDYNLFSQLWDALVVNRPTVDGAVAPISNGMKDSTAAAFIEYGEGNKSKVNEIRALLGRAAIN